MTIRKPAPRGSSITASWLPKPGRANTKPSTARPFTSTFKPSAQARIVAVATNAAATHPPDLHERAEPTASEPAKRTRNASPTLVYIIRPPHQAPMLGQELTSCPDTGTRHGHHGTPTSLATIGIPANGASSVTRTIVASTQFMAAEA